MAHERAELEKLRAVIMSAEVERSSIELRRNGFQTRTDQALIERALVNVKKALTNANVKEIHNSIRSKHLGKQAKLVRSRIQQEIEELLACTPRPIQSAQSMSSVEPRAMARHPKGSAEILRAVVS